ncbi:hypothetical protein JYT44_01585 [Caldithrix abyssi]|nr:hypothetical protein [Caldithrix abyssi]
MKKIYHFFFWIGLIIGLNGQSIQLQKLDSGVLASFRGLNVVNKKVVWVSGTSGTVLRTVNGGKTWEDVSIPDLKNTDFRDIHGFDSRSAIAMGIASPARFFKTIDGGKTWRQIYLNNRKGVFFDGMAFWDNKRGMAFSDPVDGHHLIIRTEDGGESWQEVPSANIPEKLDLEFGFAASGTGIPLINRDLVWIGMGGEKSRVFRSENGGKDWSVFETPVIHGGQTTGIYSLTFKNRRVGIAVGGDYKNLEAKNTMAYTMDGGKTWSLPETQTHQYRECVTHFKGKIFFAVGPTGIDMTTDNGKNWTFINADIKDLSAIDFAKGSNVGFSVGKRGQIFKIKVTD